MEGNVFWGVAPEVTGGHDRCCASPDGSVFFDVPAQRKNFHNYQIQTQPENEAVPLLVQEHKLQQDPSTAAPREAVREQAWPEFLSAGSL